MDNKDIILLRFLATFNEPTKISEQNATHEIKVNFQFQGTEKAKNPDSIHVRLFELAKYNLVKSRYANMWEITNTGRTELIIIDEKAETARIEKRAIKIFINWSGKRSKIIATALKDCLSNIFPYDIFFMSNYDIDAGSRWGDKLNSELEESNFGIVCFTPESLNTYG
jgi:hypothetical protein